MNWTSAIAGEELLSSTEIPAGRGSRVAAVIRSEEEEPSIVQVLTSVLWGGLLIIGGLGFSLPYLRPAVPPAEPEPLQAQFLAVRLTTEELPVLESVSTESADSSPIVPAVIIQPPTVQPLPAVEPTPSIAFALPVSRPAPVNPASQPVSSLPAGNTQSLSASGTAVQPLTFGRGEGKQPAPEYPMQARREGQEGSVRVRLSVGSDGRVIVAEAVEASQWPMLNDSVLRTIRKRWRFTPGSMRLFEVVIHFKLNH